MSLADAAARGGAVTLAGQLARFLVQLLATALLARLIAPAEFGLYTMVFAVIGIATVLGDFGLSMAAIQSQTITSAQRSNLFWTNAAIGCLLTGAVFLSAPLIAAFYGDDRLIGIAQLLSVTFLLNSLTAQFRAEVSVRLRFKALAGVDVLAVIAGLATALTLAVHDFGYWALIAQQIAIAAVTLLGLIAASGWLPGLPRRGADMRALYSYGANTLGVQLFSYLTSNVDSILIGRFWGPSPLGLYDRAYQLFRLPLQQIAAPMTKVALPVLSRLQADDRYEAYVQRAQLVLGYAFGGAFFLLASVSDPAVDILLGEGWEPAKPIFTVLALGGVFQGMGFVYYWVFLSRALTGIQLRWTLIGRSAMVVAMCVGVIWGPLGVAIGAAVGQAVNWTLQSLFPMRHSGLRRLPLLRIAVRPILLYTPLVALSLFMSYGLFTDMEPVLEALILSATIVAYLALAALVPPIRHDYAQLWDVARRFRR
ncbi:lipopolysaccharide biosynthesis protein [Microbacterium oryzae]|nr:lipopolysaccharide biosynthesis protein [Microbacterium oryzae]MDN3310450.1 lipopolysaccharide biosynthesis protein [Microbacterium oryzae]